MNMDELVRVKIWVILEGLETCSGPAGGFSEQGSERQKLTRTSSRKRRSKAEGGEWSKRTGILRYIGEEMGCSEKRREVCSCQGCSLVHSSQDMGEMLSREAATAAAAAAASGQQRHDIWLCRIATGASFQLWTHLLLPSRCKTRRFKQ